MFYSWLVLLQREAKDAKSPKQPPLGSIRPQQFYLKTFVKN
jgi:hypothetical protein